MYQGPPNLNPLRQKTLLRQMTHWWVALLLVAGLTFHAAAQQAPLPVNQVKAAFLVNFPKYITWPVSGGPTNQPIVIGIYGDTKVTDELKPMLSNKSVNGRPITYKRIQSEDDALSGCHVIFIADSERRRIPAVLEKLKGQSVLTVGESEEFLDKGGMINLVLRDKKVRVDVNLDATRKAQLEVSSKLLAVADVVKGKAK